MRSHVSFHGCHTSCRVCASAWLSQAITNPVIGLGMECHASSDGIPTPAINIHQVKWKKVVHSVVNLFALIPNPSIYEEEWHISCHGKLLYMLLYMWKAKGMTGLHHVLYMYVFLSGCSYHFDYLSYHQHEIIITVIIIDAFIIVVAVVVFIIVLILI